MQANSDKPCSHNDFEAFVTVARIGEAETLDGLPKAYSAEITVKCAACGERFRWIGVEAGSSPQYPMVSPDEFELRAPIRPASSDPDFGLGIPGFAIRVHGGSDG